MHEWWRNLCSPLPSATTFARRRDGSSIQCHFRWSERNASFPGNEILLSFQFGFGSDVTGGYLDNEIQDSCAHLLDRCLSGDDGSGIDVDDIVHATRQVRVGG